MPKLVTNLNLKPDQPVHISLEESHGFIRINAKRGIGKTWVIADINPDGSFYFHSGLGDDLGFDLGPYRKVKIVNSSL